MKKKKLLTSLLILGILPLLRMDFVNAQGMQMDWTISSDPAGTRRVPKMTQDLQKNLIFGGYYYYNHDFDPGPGVFMMGSTNVINEYVLKLDSAGNFQWAKSFSSTNYLDIQSITTDGFGSIYCVGYFRGTVDFDPGPGVVNRSSYSINDQDGFIFKLTPDGNFVWVRKVGHSGNDNITAVAADDNDGIYIAGTFMGQTDLNPSTGFNNRISVGMSDGFIIKMDSSGQHIWSNNIVCSTGEDHIYDIVVDSLQNVIFCGSFPLTADFCPGSCTYPLTALGGNDGFIGKLDSAGNLSWAKTIRGQLEQIATALVISASGDIYCTGFCNADTDLDPGSTNEFHVGMNNIFVLRLDPVGDFSWGFATDSPSYEFATDLDLDAVGNAYITGYYTGTLELEIDSSQTFIPGDSLYYNYFIMKVDSGGQLRWAKGIGSSGSEEGSGVQATDAGNVYTTGHFSNTVDFDPSSSIDLHTAGVKPASFIQKFVPCDCSFDTVSVYVCESYVPPSGNQVWNLSGIYTDILTNHKGCDSLITINLTVGHPHSTINASFCGSYHSPSGLHIWSQSGTYHETLTATNGCDSVITINLVSQNSTALLSRTACHQYIAPSGAIFTHSGVYHDTIPNHLDCDSILTIYLTITDPDESVTILNPALSCNDPNASYQWVNCSEGYTPVSGATNQTFTPTGDDYFAVIVTENGCSDTSECFSALTIHNVSPFDAESLHLFPNPTHDVVMLEFITSQDWAQVTVTDPLGQIVLQQSHFNQRLIALPLTGSLGMYFVSVETGEGSKRFKVLKQ